LNRYSNSLGLRFASLDVFVISWLSMRLAQHVVSLASISRAATSIWAPTAGKRLRFTGHAGPGEPAYRLRENPASTLLGQYSADRHPRHVDALRQNAIRTSTASVRYQSETG